MSLEMSVKKSEIRICAGILQNAQSADLKDHICARLYITSATFDKYATRLIAKGFLETNGKTYQITKKGMPVLAHWNRSIEFL